MFATNASDAIWWSNMELIQVAPSGGHVCNQCKWRYLVVKFGINMQVVHPVVKLATNAGGAIWWANFQPSQEVSLKSISNYSS